MADSFRKICIVAVNASYSHSSLSARCLAKSFDNDILVREYTINDISANVAAELYKDFCGIYAFSCYIWNSEFVLDVCRILKTALPQCTILLGGPEVSYDAKSVMHDNDFVDFVICGEGEISLCEFANGVAYDKIGGLVYRDNGEIIKNPIKIIDELDKLPRLYTPAEIHALENKIIYYETSRGCPYNCSYCLSSTSHGVRFFSLQRVFEDFKIFMDCGVRLVKLVDRTFNIDRKRTKQILQFILANNKCTCFHFEVTADILDDETVEILNSAPKGTFQLEIGVQSTNAQTIEAICRKTDMNRLKSNILKLHNARDMHIHLDIIAGLPYEKYELFKQSFDDVFAMRPDMLQLGFLKLLKGTKIRADADEFHYRFNPKPPYEVIANDFISYDEILTLKDVWEIVERYYNSASFEKSLSLALTFYERAYDFFYDFSRFWRMNGYFSRPQSKKSLYDIFFEFGVKNIKSQLPFFVDCLKFDFVRNNKNAVLPHWAPRTGDKAFYKAAYEFLQSEAGAAYIPQYIGVKLSAITRAIKVEKFNFDVCGDGNFGECVIIFNYEDNSFKKITEKI